MKVIGLTGGIATGKSTVTKYLMTLGIRVVDTDHIAHDLLNNHQEMMAELVEYFGLEVQNQDGTINRRALGQIIFNSEIKRLKLNEIVHPRVKEVCLNEIEHSKHNNESIIVLDVPLLFESSFDELCDFTIVVSCNHDVQLQRLINRENISNEEALLRMNAQMPLSMKEKKADYVVDNNFDEITTYKQINTILNELGI